MLFCRCFWKQTLKQKNPQTFCQIPSKAVTVVIKQQYGWHSFVSLCDRKLVSMCKGEQRNNVRWGNPNNPVRALPCPLLGLSQQSDQPHCPDVKPIRWINMRAFCVTLETEGGYCLESMGHSMGCKRRASWNCTRFIMGCLGQESKVGKGRDQGCLGGSKCGKIEG